MKFTKENITEILKEEIAAEIRQSKDTLDSTAHFAAHGLDSLNCIYVLYQVEKRMDIELNPALFWDYPTIEALAAHLHQTQKSDG